MERADVLAVMAILKAAYPGYYKGMSRKDADGIVGLWTDMFAEDDPAAVGAAVKALIATDAKGFPPHIGAVKEKLRQISQPAQMSPAEAWGMVWRAVQRSGYNSREEFDRLPETLRRLVGSPEQLKAWSQMDADTVQSVIGSNFQRSYTARRKADADYNALPADVKQMLAGVTERMALHGEHKV